ncbi:MAG: DUF4189 domain-containing protein [Parvularculaceae bacterium]
MRFAGAKIFTVLGTLILLSAACGRAADEADRSAASRSAAQTLPDDAAAEKPVDSPSPDTAPDTAPAPPQSSSDDPLQMEFNTYSGTEGPYGAISMVSANGKVIGYVGYDEPDKDTAMRLALEGCREKAGAAGAGCKVAVVFENACGAFASTNDGGYGTGWGDTGAIACRWALDSCDDDNKSGCKADAYVCSPGGRNGTCDGGLTIEGDTTTIRSDQ